MQRHHNDTKRVLLVAGTGTLGGPAYAELVKLGYSVDVISLEDFKSVTPRLSFLKADASTDKMEGFLDGRHYDAIVDFLHVPGEDAQKRRIDLMLGHTDQFVFLSSYRTYSDRDRIITESSEQWIDAPANDRMLLEEEFAGAHFAWIPTADYLKIATDGSYMQEQMIWTDRNLDRRVDFSKVLRVTGLSPSRFMSCRDAIAHELTILSERPDLVARFDTPFRRELDTRMDAYFGKAKMEARNESDVH